MDNFLKRGQFKNSNGSLIRKSINPLSIPHEFKSNLQRSNILDASLLELPNISIDKTNESSNSKQLSITDTILIEKFRENEVEIFEFIKNQDCQNRLLFINKSKFSDLFKIKDQLMVDNIFNIYKTVQKTSSKNNLINNNTLPSSFKNNGKFSKRKSSILKENKIGGICRNEIENTLKIPIGGNSFPIPVENNDNSSSGGCTGSGSNIDSIHSSPIEVNKTITESNQNSSSSSSSSSINTRSILSESCSQSNSLTASSLYSGISSETSLDGSDSFKNVKDLKLQNVIENGDTRGSNIVDGDSIVGGCGQTTTSSEQLSQISITPPNNSTLNTPIFNDPNFQSKDPHTQSLPIIKASPSPSTLKMFKSKSFSSSFSIRYGNQKKIKKSKTFQIDQKLNLFDIINQIYLNISKIGSSEEERIQSIFKLYDIYNQGFISRNNLKEVLIYRTRQNGLKFQDFTMESLIDHIFEQFDKNLDGFIDFEEFKNELTVNESLIEKEVQQEAEDEEKDENVGINNLKPFINNNSVKNNINTTTKEKTTNNLNFLINNSKTNSLKRYLKIEGSKLFFICLFLIINSILGVISFIGVYNNNKKALELFGSGLYITRVAAQLILFNASIILVTMCKQLFTMIRNTRFKSLFPVDKYMTFHKLIGYTLIVASFLHTIGWFIGMAIATGKPDSVFYDCLSPHFKFRPTVWEMIFNSLPGVTGFIMISLLTIIGAFSLKVVRKSSFELFYYSHHLFIAFYILLILHGTMGWIRPPTFWKWFIVPAVLYASDRGYRLFKRTYRVGVVDFSLKNERVINLSFHKPSTFNYKPGQYLLINIPKISKLQWHPFTMTSSPLEDTIQVHIRVTGGWTKRLFKMLTLKKQQQEQTQQLSNTEILDFDVEIASKSIFIHIDGPFGSSSQYALNQKQVILVGAGIGVAPMASLLKDISLKKQRLRYLDESNLGDVESREIFEQSKHQITTKYGLGNLEKVHFFWLNRDQYSFQWFEDLLVDISRNGNTSVLPKISINTFNTRVFPRNDVRIFMLWNGYNKLFKENGLDPTTNLPFKTHWGRPNWDTIFQYYSTKYSGESISVFCCGPPQLSKQLYEKCRYNTNLKSNGTKFYFHKENF